MLAGFVWCRLTAKQHWASMRCRIEPPVLILLPWEALHIERLHCGSRSEALHGHPSRTQEGIKGSKHLVNRLGKILNTYPYSAF